jgi:predicted transcriptional regulator
MRMATGSPKSLKLDPATAERLNRLAGVRERSPHYLMVQAVQQYVEREEIFEQAKQDALDAWSEYEATGMHVTAAEADAWLAKLEAGEIVDVPECRS